MEAISTLVTEDKEDVKTKVVKMKAIKTEVVKMEAVKMEVVKTEAVKTEVAKRGRPRWRHS